MNNTLVQTENKAFVVGLLKEKKIEFKPTKSGRMMAQGHLVIVTNTPQGKGEVRVKVMQMADTKDGKPNNLYKALQTIQSTYKSIAEVGEEQADLVKINGELADETYFSVNKDEFVESLQIKGTFINRIDKLDENGVEKEHCCKIMFEGLISAIRPLDKTNELEVELIGVGYGGVAVPVKGNIPTNLVQAFQGRYSVGCSASLNLAIINTVETTVLQDDTVFGEGIGEIIERTTTKRVIFGGGAPSYDKLNQEQIKQALAIRETKLEEKKQKAIERSGAPTMNNGFGAPTTGGFGAPMNGTGNIGFGIPNGGFQMPTGFGQ